MGIRRGGREDGVREMGRGGVVRGGRGGEERGKMG